MAVPRRSLPQKSSLATVKLGAPKIPCRSKGESFRPCAVKIGPHKNGRQTTSVRAASATASIRITDRYEYVLEHSYQK